MIPKDPIMLLSYVNTMLRDKYSSVTDLCRACLLYTSMRIDKWRIKKIK